jgi:hypothetical protein
MELYCGPFVKIKNQSQNVKVMAHCCVNPDCSVYKKFTDNNDMFCGKCGNQRSFTEIDSVQPMKLWEIFDKDLNYHFSYFKRHDYFYVFPKIETLGGIKIDSSGEFNIPILTFENSLWNSLFESLNNKKIEFEKKIQILVFL